MTLDLVLLGLVLVFAVFGLASGAARQIASLIAAAAAYLCARPIGNALGHRVALALQGPDLFGVLATTLLAFIVVLITVRYLLTALLRRLLRGKERERAGLDRVSGFLLGGGKVVLIAYVMLSALSFVEDNVTIAGKRLGISPKESQAFALARQYNLFERAQFAPVKDLVRVAQALQDPVRAEQIRQDPAFRALLQDPRFRAALAENGMAQALENGDYGALLRSNTVLQLVQDRLAAARMAAAAESVEGIPKSPSPPRPGPPRKPH